MLGDQEEKGLKENGWNKVFTFGNTDAKIEGDAYWTFDIQTGEIKAREVELGAIARK